MNSHSERSPAGRNPDVSLNFNPSVRKTEIKPKIIHLQGDLTCRAGGDSHIHSVLPVFPCVTPHFLSLLSPSSVIGCFALIGLTWSSLT